MQRPVRKPAVSVVLRSAAYGSRACTKCTLTEWEGTTIVFELASAGPDRTELTFRHVGLRPSLDCYDSCSLGWDHYLRSLRSLVETGTGMPYGS